MSRHSVAFITADHRARAVVGCIAAVTLALVGGCGTTHGVSGGQRHVTAGQAVALAARSAAKLTSLTVVETMTVHGIPHSAGSGLIPGATTDGGGSASQNLTMHATASMRLKPTLLAAVAVKMDFAGKSLTIDEILTSRAIYLKMPGMIPTRPGKPWAKISVASLPNGMSLRKLFQQMQTRNPLTTLGNPRALTKFLAATKHLRVVRDQSVDGVATTEYSGVINMRPLATTMPAAAREFFGSFRPHIMIWIDHQHQMRKVVVRFAFGKASGVLTALVTSINKPVRIVPPPASQVSAISHP
jgi:hypothetical protein